MSNSKVPGWHAVLADASTPVFGFIMGMVTGAVGAVIATPIAPTSESLKFYLAVLSPGLGAAGGAMVGLFLEKRKDNLARKRKIKGAMHRVTRVCMQITAVLNQIEALKHLEEDDVLAGREIDDPLAKPILLFGSLIDRLMELGAHPPNFDEILETNEDTLTASHIEELFRAMTRLPLKNRGDGVTLVPLRDAAVALATLRETATKDRMVEWRDTLQACAEHFENKAR